MSRRARVGLYGILVIALLLLGAQRLDAIVELMSDSDEVTAYFTDSSGLAEGDRVEIAGIAVGRVREVEIDGSRIRVVAGVDSPVELGDRTRAAIKVGNLLGSKYLELEPRGTSALTQAIPLERTSPAYDVVSAVSDLSDTIEDIDTEQLATALDTVAKTFRGSSPQIRRAVTGVSALSRTIANRDQELHDLLARRRAGRGLTRRQQGAALPIRPCRGVAPGRGRPTAGRHRRADRALGRAVGAAAWTGARQPAPDRAGAGQHHPRRRDPPGQAG